MLKLRRANITMLAGVLLVIAAIAATGSLVPMAVAQETDTATSQETPAPTEAAQETEPPTEEPAPTEEPEPTDEPVEETEEPEDTEEPADEETESPAADDADSDDGDDFPWEVVLGIIVVVAIIGGAIALFSALTSGGRRAEADWQKSALDTYGQGVALHDAIIADLLTRPSTPAAAGEVQQIAAGTTRRLDDLSTQLNVLSTRAPSKEAATAVQSLLIDLGTLRSSVQSHTTILGRADPAPTEAQLTESETALRGRLSAFQAALQTFRAAI